MAVQKPSTHVALTDGRGKAALVDLVAGALVAVDHAHAHVHEGEAFVVSAVDESMADNETIIIAFKTPAVKSVHLVVSFSVTIAGHVEVMEDPTWTTNTGTARTIYNRHRGSTTTADLSEDKSATPDFTAGAALIDPTGLAGGTIIATQFHLAGPGSKEGGANRGITEFILAQDTRYAVKLTADGNSNGGQLVLDWYEHEHEGSD